MQAELKFFERRNFPEWKITLLAGERLASPGRILGIASLAEGKQRSYCQSRRRTGSEAWKLGFIVLRQAD
jgi:hypothetical protein